MFNPIILVIIFFAAFTHSVAGIGIALVSMPLLVGILTLDEAAALILLCGATVKTFVLLRHRKGFTVRAAWRLIVAAAIGIPVGLFVPGTVSDDLVRGLLGVVIAGYAVYSFITPRLPSFAHSGWAFGFGFFGGVLLGAYSIVAPPIIIYANGRKWGPSEFKANMQAYSISAAVVTLLLRAETGNIAPAAVEIYLFALPVMVLGLAVGFSLDNFIKPDLFRKIVLAMLLLAGILLIF